MKMGRPFYECLGDENLYCCGNCKLNLTCLKECVCKDFMSNQGPAAIFKRVVNVNYGDIEDRKFITGPHKVRNAFCKRCNTKVGWMYEFAKAESQRYKEGCTMLFESAIYGGFKSEANPAK